MTTKKSNKIGGERIFSIIISILAAVCFLFAAGQAFARTPRALEDLAESIAKQIGKGYKKTSAYNREAPAPLVFVGKAYFSDPHSGAAYPFSSFFAVEMKKALADTGLFTVTDDPGAICPMVLTGDYYRQSSGIVASCTLKGLSMSDGVGEQAAVTLASGREELGSQYFENAWFKEDVSNKMFFLMRKLEDDFSDKISFGKKPSVQVHKFSYQKSTLYSPFSDYLTQHVTSYLSQSGRLTPKMDMQSVLGDVRAIKTRGVMPKAKTKEAAIADLGGADHYVTGSYWQPSPDVIEVQAVLANKKGDVLASEAVQIPANLVGSGLLELPQKNDAGFMADQQSFSPSSGAAESGPLSVDVFTNKGRNNLLYTLDEKIIFYIKTSQPAYVRIFNRNADGGIMQIFPNQFDEGYSPVQAGRVTPVPDSDRNADFEFVITQPLGNEIVKVYASSKPLPQLPSTDLGFFGVRQMNISAKEIQTQYEQYALRMGVALAQDMITLRTQEKGAVIAPISTQTP